MRRTLFTLAAGLSAVLLVAVCALWWRSWVLRETEWAGRSSDRAKFEIRSADGKLFVFWADRPSPEGPQPWEYRHFEEMRDFDPPGEPTQGLLGVESRYSDRFGGGKSLWLTLPDWAVALCFLILPAAWAARRVRRQRRLAHRRSHGLCPACGYDLCATPDRCPECGAVPAQGAA